MQNKRASRDGNATYIYVYNQTARTNAKFIAKQNRYALPNNQPTPTPVQKAPTTVMANHRTSSPTRILFVIESWIGRRSERERRNSEGMCRGSGGRCEGGQMGDAALGSGVIASLANATSRENLDSHSHLSMSCLSINRLSASLCLSNDCSVSGCCFAFSISRHRRKRSAASRRSRWSAAGRRNRVVRR